MPANHTEVEKRLWDAADELRANSKLKSSEYSFPVLGLIFLRYADHKFAQAERELVGAMHATPKRQRPISKIDYQARGVLYLPEGARFANLLKLPEGANIGKAINDAMRAIEEHNEDLKDVLPKTYNHLENSLLVSLLKTLNSIPMDVEQLFDDLLAFVDRLNAEERRHMAEQLSEEELALFDLLTRPGMKLNKQQTRQVKQAAQDLLAALKKEKLVLDWRKKQQARARVRLAIEDMLWGLVPIYTEEQCRQKCDVVYQHVYDSYYGQGRGVYAVAA